ncbi:MAG: hypothetical protein IJU44_05720 [Kiritimatiellae bacterium]|nr:hypothetical protein [Kiritimatiellia bacterium]
MRLQIKLWGVLAFMAAAAVADGVSFRKAQPVWPEGREREKNLFVGFYAKLTAPELDRAVLRITGSSVYRIYLNGEFLGYGPARGPHGWDRVDEWPLKPLARAGENHLAIEVAGYNVNSFYLIDEPAYLQAEVVRGGEVVAATSPATAEFSARLLPREQKVPRYSFQRPFGEAYHLDADSKQWRVGKSAAAPLKLAAQPQQKLLDRIAPYPDFKKNTGWKALTTGDIKVNPEKRLWADRAIKNIGPKLGGFPERELTSVPIYEVQKMESANSSPCSSQRLELSDRRYYVVDWGLNDTGFIGGKFRCTKPGKLYVTFDELLSGNDVSPVRMSCSNVVVWELKTPGEYDLESFEPYTMRYSKIISDGAAGEFADLYLRTYKNSATGRATFHSSDPDLDKIFEAARETFVQNAVDVFTDCPSRERAGWLCDSYFTSRASQVLCGNTDMERLFLQNFVLPDQFKSLPKGVFAMCYPSDHPDGTFIPNWAMWLVVELDEYARRSGDRELVEQFRPKVLALIDFLKKYQNSDGLLEKLPSWVFVEWSRANSLVQDVNYPSNMTFAWVLSCAARMYNLPELEREAEAIRATIRKQSWDGTFFIDNAVRQPDGKLKLSGERTETCQYYAFFFRTATPETHPELWAKLRDDFGPARSKTKKFPEIHPSNAFIGNFLRLEILSRAGLSAQILDETKGYFLYMAERTGTLWENITPNASCNHGFASHVAVMLFRDVLGVRELDPLAKTVKIEVANLPLESCEGTVPVLDGEVKVSWRKVNGRPELNVSTPPGWKVVK